RHAAAPASGYWPSARHPGSRRAAFAAHSAWRSRRRAMRRLCLGSSAAPPLLALTLDARGSARIGPLNNHAARTSPQDRGLRSRNAGRILPRIAKLLAVRLPRGVLARLRIIVRIGAHMAAHQLFRFRTLSRIASRSAPRISEALDILGACIARISAPLAVIVIIIVVRFGRLQLALRVTLPSLLGSPDHFIAGFLTLGDLV